MNPTLIAIALLLAAGYDFCPTLAPQSGIPAEQTSYGPPARFLARHKLEGTASYYSDYFEGRTTANGEIFRQSGLTAAHRTLPFGTILEVRSRATGRSARIRINDRGPFKGGFAIDRSKAAARAIGVDRAHDPRVRMIVIYAPRGRE